MDLHNYLSPEAERLIIAMLLPPNSFLFQQFNFFLAYSGDMPYYSLRYTKLVQNVKASKDRFRPFKEITLCSFKS